MPKVRSGAADALTDSLCESLHIPRERLIEFFMHRTRRGRTLITVRYDASDVTAPPIETMYELNPIDETPTPDTALPAFTVTGDVPLPDDPPRKRWWTKKKGSD